MSAPSKGASSKGAPTAVTPGGVTPHLLVNPPSVAPAVGFTHAVMPVPGRLVYLGGQTGMLPDGSYVAGALVEQFDQAAANIATVLEACGARPEHLVQLTVYTTDAGAYRASLKEIGAVYRRHLGRHYPAMALFGVSELFDPEALVELVGIAVIPDAS